MTTPAERLRQARERAGYDTAKGAAEAMGAPVSTYIQHENGGRGFPSQRAARYAKFFRVRPEWLLYGQGDGQPTVAEPALTSLPLAGQIRAGAWLSVDDSSQESEMPMLTAAHDPRYPHARQWLREVVGDSMNAKGINQGDLVHIVDWAEAGPAMKTGMIVEVTRTRDDGELREVTLKEIEMTPKGPLLWARSTNPRWKAPIPFDEGGHGDQVEVKLTGLLLAAIRRF